MKSGNFRHGALCAPLLPQRRNAIVNAPAVAIVLLCEGFGRLMPLRSVGIKMFDAVSTVIWNCRNAAIQCHTDPFLVPAAFGRDENGVFGWLRFMKAEAPQFAERFHFRQVTDEPAAILRTALLADITRLTAFIVLARRDTVAATAKRGNTAGRGRICSGRLCRGWGATTRLPVCLEGSFDASYQRGAGHCARRS
jgi:hypothetical protein